MSFQTDFLYKVILVNGKFAVASNIFLSEILLNYVEKVMGKKLRFENDASYLVDFSYSNIIKLTMGIPNVWPLGTMVCNYLNRMKSFVIQFVFQQVIVYPMLFEWRNFPYFFIIKIKAR